MSNKTEKILSNTERRVKHFFVSDQVMAHFQSWKILNGFKNQSDAFEEMVRKQCMQNVTNDEHLLSNKEIAIRPHRPLKTASLTPST